MTTGVHKGFYLPSEETFEWESDASGDATITLPNYKDRLLINIKTIPDSGVSAYDVTIVDEDGLDWLDGEGFNRSTTLAEVFFAITEIHLPDQELTLTIANAGNTQSGTVILRLN